MTDLRTRLSGCFAAVFPDLTPDEIAAARPQTVPAWDSVANVTLLAVVEEEFDVALAADDLEGLDSFGALLAYLQVRAVRAQAPR